MNFTTHFHTDYTSSGAGATYTQVSVEIDGFGMFCVIRNKNTGRIQRQAYLLLEYGTRNYIGLSHKGYFNGVDSLKQAWAGLNDADKSNILDCVNNLDSGFRRFVRKYKEISGTTPPDENEVHSYLNMLIFVMNGDSTVIPTSHNDAENTTTVGTASESTSRNWVEAKISELSANDLQSIMQMIYEKENPEEGVEYKGDRYRLMYDDNGKMIIRMLKKDSTCEGGNGLTANGRKQQNLVVIPAPPKPKRNTKRMAFMMNNENLTEFVNGCYYQFVKECVGGYIKILNDANEERTVSKSRVSLIDVYDQPPLDEVTA